MLSFVEQFKLKSSGSIYFLKGIDRTRAVWYYILIDRIKLPLFLSNYKSSDSKINLNDYGKILISGWGETPDQQAINYINTFLKNK